MLYIDLKEILIQLCFFIFTIIVLNKILFKPILKIYSTRKEKTDDVFARTNEIKENLSSKIKEYETKINEAKIYTAREKEKTLAIASSEAKKITGEARRESNKKLETITNELTASLEKAKTEAKSMTSNLSNDLVLKILGRKV